MNIENDGFEEVAANTTEDTATLPIEQETITEEPSTEVAEIEPTETVKEEPKEFTETQAFSRRLKEATQKALDQDYDDRFGISHNIHSKADYDNAIKEQERQEELEELSKSVNPDVARELQEGREFRRKYETEQKTKAEQDKIQKGYDEFSREYPDVKGDDIPSEVWQAVNEGGKSLTDAYARYETKSLKERIKTLEHNKNNDDKSPVGSVTSYGSKETAEEDDFMKGFNSY